MSLLQINEISKIKGNISLLPELTLSINAGECVVIQCQNELGLQFIHSVIGKESLSSGSILFEGHPLNHFKTVSQHIAISFLEDGLYSALRVTDYLKFFQAIYHSSVSIEDTMNLLSLDNVKNQAIQKLSFTVQKRVHLARCIIQHPKLIILEEPEQNIDTESQLLIRKAIALLCSQGTAFLITSTHLSNALSVTNEVYTLTAQSFKRVQLADELPLTEDNITVTVETETVAPEVNVETLNELSEAAATIETLPLKVEKIPAKVDDKIILFDPTEIDFIESHDGICLLQVKGDNFPCTFTMNELEQKLRLFGFFRCHRSYIVNLQKVREVITWTRNSFSLILDDKKKTSIPLSKSKYDELKSIIGI